MAPRPRRVNRSRELDNSAKAVKPATVLAELIGRIERGELLTPQLSSQVHDPYRHTASPKPSRRSDRDLPLAD